MGTEGHDASRGGDVSSVQKVRYSLLVRDFVSARLIAPLLRGEGPNLRGSSATGASLQAWTAGH